jgi:hypothetical protein
MAQTESSNSSAGASSQKKDELGTAEEIISGPFSEYGEFDSSEDEAADEKFFQFGRFCGQEKRND